MKKSIEILKEYQAWRTHQCDIPLMLDGSGNIATCGKQGCKMPETTPSELSKAIDDVIEIAEQYYKLVDNPKSVFDKQEPIKL